MARPPLLFASYSGVLGGAERVLLDCVTRLERELTVACPEGPLAAALRAAGIAHTPVKERPLKLGPAHAGGIAGLALRAAAAQAGVHRRVGRKSGAGHGARPDVRWLAVHHDLLPSPAVRGAVRATTKRANGVAAASHAIARQFKGDVTVLHPGVDLTRFTPQPLPAGPPHALVLGALVPWKRPELAFEIAAHDARAAGDDRRSDASRRRPVSRWRRRRQVTLAGQIDDVPRALANAHLLLHCADEEPYGMALVEALARAGRSSRRTAAVRSRSSPTARAASTRRATRVPRPTRSAPSSPTPRPRRTPAAARNSTSTSATSVARLERAIEQATT